VRKPNLFIVGAPKCGTTSLYAYLCEHPQIFMSPIKEPQFFAEDRRGERRRIRKLENYLKCFAGAGDEPVVGEASTAYFASPRAPFLIKEFAPDARIIIMLRSPVDKMYSRYGDARFTNQEPHPAFSDAIDAELANGPSFGLGYINSSRYAEHVETYFRVFGRERVHVILYEDFKDRTAQLYAEVLRFLGAQATTKSDFPILNASRRARSALLQEFVRCPPEPLRRLARSVLSQPARRRIRDWCSRINLIYAPQPPLDREFRNRLYSFFEDDIRQLGMLIGRDLSCWLKGD